MQTDTILNTVVLGILVGLTTFAISYALAVWRKRHRSLSEGREHGTSPRWLRSLCLLAAAGGVGAIAIFLVMREIQPRWGYLRPRSLFAVRSREDMTVERLVTGTKVEKGQTLVGFHSPDSEARIESAEAKKAALEAEKKALSRAPLERASRLVGKRQRVHSTILQLEAMLDRLIPARDRFDHGLHQARADKKESLSDLRAVIVKNAPKLKKARARAATAEKQVKRLKKLEQDKYVTEEKLEEAKLEAQLSQLEAKGQKKYMTVLRQQTEQLEPELQKIVDTGRENLKRVTERVDWLKSKLEEYRRRRHEVEARLDDDLTRAETRREAQLQRVQNEIEQQELATEALRREQQVKAPYEGRVVYRALSPNAMGERNVILALACRDGLRARLRVPAREVPALEEAGSVRLELGADFIQQRFEGRFLKTIQKTGDADYSTAVFACQPPPEAIRNLANGEEVKVTLQWRPPLSGSYLFLAGAAVLFVGCSGLVFAAAGVGKQKAQKQASADQSAGTAASQTEDEGSRESPPASHAGHEALYGAAGSMLTVLGARFRNEITSGEPNRDTLAAVEWALDRHHRRAVEVLSDILGNSPEFMDRAPDILDELAREAEHNPAARETRDRLLRILRVLAPDAVRDRRSGSGS